jgi:DNA polymerase-2
MPLDRVSAAIASIDSLYLRALRSRRTVAPSVSRTVRQAGITGGYVMDSQPGLYRNVLVFDFKSLYPSIIRTFNLDPLTLVPDGETGG